MLFSLNRIVLAILDKCSHLTGLKQLQAHLIVLGHAQTHFYVFKLIRFCTVDLHNLHYARYMFDKFHSPNVYIYTAMLTAYASAFDHTSCMLLFRHMIRENRSKPNHFVFSVVLKSCPVVLENYGTELVQAQIVKSGFGENHVVLTAILDAYSRYGLDIGSARKVFDEMRERNVVSWTAMISGYARVGLMGNAVLLFEEMPEGIRDTPLWNCMLAGCIENGLFLEAIGFFRRMTVEDGTNRPNQVTLVCVLSAFGHAGMLQLGRCVHGYACRNGLGLDLFLVNGLIDMYGKCGNLGKARMMFNSAVGRNLTSWNSLINCYAMHGQSEECVCIFEEMPQKEHEVNPDAITFIGLLNACSHGGLVVEGRCYFDMMIREYGIEPGIEHYGCLIDLLGRAGRFEEAMQVVKGMRIPPDEVIWGALLNGCKIHRHADLAMYAFKKLAEINSANVGYGSILANLYVEMGEWNEVLGVRNSFPKKNTRKTPGCSWIEVDNQVHHFHSVDKLHPKMPEIFEVLECLAG